MFISLSNCEVDWNHLKENINDRIIDLNSLLKLIRPKHLSLGCGEKQKKKRWAHFSDRYHTVGAEAVRSSWGHFKAELNQRRSQSSVPFQKNRALIRLLALSKGILVCFGPCVLKRGCRPLCTVKSTTWTAPQGSMQASYVNVPLLLIDLCK